MLKKLAFMTALTVFSMTCVSTAIAKSYVVKLTGQTRVASEDSIEVKTTKGWEYIYYFGLDNKSVNALDNAIKKKSCVRITYTNNDSPKIIPAKCPVKKK